MGLRPDCPPIKAADPTVSGPCPGGVEKRRLCETADFWGAGMSGLGGQFAFVEQGGCVGFRCHGARIEGVT